VSTKDGFVLAGDSQGSSGCRALPGDYEKVFSIGKQSGIVVAGIIGQQMDQDAWSSLATTFHFYDQQAGGSEPQPQAVRAMYDFLFGMSDILSLVDDSVELDSPLQASAVSIGDDGSPEWITLYLVPVRRQLLPDNERWDYRVIQIVDPPPSKVIALGSGGPRVDEIIKHADPNDPGLTDPGIKRYALLKREHRLSELSLGDGELLARFLVQSVISYAKDYPCLGIGGDLQMLAVTRQGVDWVVPLDKAKLAPQPALAHVQIRDSPILGFQPLDGIRWIRPTVWANAVIHFDGDADASVSRPTFNGKCTFQLGAKAEEKMPETAEKLRRIFAPRCDVYLGSALLSQAPSVVTNLPRVQGERDDYGPLCNIALKAKERAFAGELKTFGSRYADEERLESFEEFSEELTAGRQHRSDAEVAVARFKRRVNEENSRKAFHDEYQRRFVPTATAIRHTLIKRVTVPAELVHPDAKTPFLEWYELQHELDTLTNLLPDTCDDAESEVPPFAVPIPM
jgi:hypothetical protein